jgi:ABC-2 type transport system permease protein
MWDAARTAQGGQTLGGFGRGEFAAYFLMTMIVGHLGAAWDAFEMGYLVRTGKMSAPLLRPMLPLWSSIADNLAYKIVTLAILIPLWLGVAWVAQPKFATSLTHVGLGAVATLLGAAMNFLWGYTVALVAFWTTRTDATGEFWFGGNLMFGGRFAPLTLLPMPLQWVAAVLPFKWIIWFPSATLMGQLSIPQVLGGLAAQLLWLAAGVLVFRLVWRAALKRYTAVGA